MRRNKLIFIFALLGLILSLAIGRQEQQTTVADFEKTDKQTAKLIQPTAPKEVSLPSVTPAENLPPKISFENIVCDLGEVGQGTKNTCEFKFANIGQGLLKIGNIKRTCGCTVFKLDKKEYAPGEASQRIWPTHVIFPAIGQMLRPSAQHDMTNGQFEY